MMDENDAFVSALALAYDGASFRQAIVGAFDDMGFDLIELEDAEPLSQRLAVFQMPTDILALADEVVRTGYPRFGTWYTWTSDD